MQRFLLSLAALALVAGLGFAAWLLVDGSGTREVDAVGPGSSSGASVAPRDAAPLVGERSDPRTSPDSGRGDDSARSAVPDALAETSPRASASNALVVTGRVSDEESGEPIEGVTLVAVGGAPPMPLAETDAEGRYRIDVVDEASTHVVVQPPEGWNVRVPRHALPPFAPGGSAELDFQLLRWPPPVAGDIRGLLQSEGGSWTADQLPARGTIVLDLVSTQPPRIQRRATIEAQTDGADGHWLSFAFADVPRGEYELTLSTLDDYRWHPTSVFVSPPADNVAFLRYDLDRTLPLDFLVYERTTGEPVEDYEVRHIKVTVSDDNGVFLHTGPLDREAFPMDAEFEWSLWADGLAPVFGDERSFELDEGRRVADVRLSPGWGARFLVLGGEGTKRPLRGATVYLDGELVGSTRDEGTLDVYLREPPEKVEVRYLDWELERDPLVPLRGRTAEGRGMVIVAEMRPTE